MLEFATLSMTHLHYSPTVTVIIIVVIFNANSYFGNGGNTNNVTIGLIVLLSPEMY